MCVSACNSKLGRKHVLNCMDRNEIEGLFEEAIESWPKWDLNPRPLNSVQTL